MSKYKKNSLIVWLVCSILIIFAILPVFISLGNKGNMEVPNINFSVVDYNFEFEDNSSYINLSSGEIKTNKKIEKVFVNINGYGIEDLSFSQKENSVGFYVVNLIPKNGIAGCVFDSNATVTVDVYVVVENFTYKVTTTNVNVVSAWSNDY